MEETLTQFFIGGLFITLVTIQLIAIVLTFLSNFFLFKKAGQAGWKAWCPFYNYYIQQIITFGYEKRWFFLLLFVPVAGPLYVIYLTYCYGRSFGLSSVQAIFYLLFTPIFNIYMAFSDSIRYQGTQTFFID